MKLHELCKNYEINFMDFKNHINRLGYTEYKSPNKGILDSDLEKLVEIAKNFTNMQQEIDLEKLEKRRGKFIGSVYDRKNKEFKSVLISASYRELVEKGVKFDVIESHTTIHGAVIKIYNTLKRFINVNTVQSYGNIAEE